MRWVGRGGGLRYRSCFFFGMIPQLGDIVDANGNCLEKKGGDEKRGL